MIETGIMLNLVLALAIATAGGVLAVWLKRPVIIGYLVAGVILGPFTPGPEANTEDLTFLAEVGVALLLFVTGSSLNPSRFGGLGMVILLGGAIQIALTILLGLALVPVLGLTIVEGVLIGAVLAQTSSTVIAKLLQDRQEVDSTHGRIALGISVVQDISSAPLLLLLLVFFGEEVQTVPSFLLAIGEVLLLVAMVYIVGRLIWPRILGGIERLGSRELALLTTVALALGGGLLVDALGLSFALGAFLAGIVVAESTHGRAAAGRIVPLRDVFAAMFFVFIGTLFDPAIVLRAPVELLALVGGAILGKGVISFLVVRLLRSPTQTAMMSGLLLAQIGEFAFILAGIGLERGAISQSLFSLIIAAAALSIFLNSLLVDSAPPVLGSLATVTGLRPFKKRER